MNFIIPFFFLPIAFMLGVSTSGYLENPPNITYVKKDSPAEISGFSPGDKILSVNGKKVETWRDANIAIQSNPDSLLEFEVETEGKTRKTLSFFAKAGRDGRVETGFASPLAAIIEEVSKDRPAWNAGIRPGDRVKYIDGIMVSDWNHMSDIISGSEGGELEFTIERGGNGNEFSPEGGNGRYSRALYSRHYSGYGYGS